MKKKYIAPQIEIIEFHTEDVVTLSIVEDDPSIDWGELELQ